MIKRELNLFFNAMLYYSRIKVPKGVVCNDENLKNAFGYFPLVGAIVGLIGVAAIKLFSFFLPTSIAIFFAMVAMLLSTGALHEDGAADFADGFGGGYTKEAVLRIMKDSSIGAYGVIMLVMLIALKYLLLCEVPLDSLLKVIVIAESSSRVLSVLMVRYSQYARTENSKCEHVKLGVPAGRTMLAAAFSILPLVLLGWLFALLYICFAALLFVVMYRYLDRRIGGYTGDTLGAMQQFALLIFYAVAVAVL